MLTRPKKKAQDGLWSAKGLIRPCSFRIHPRWCAHVCRHGIRRHGFMGLGGTRRCDGAEGSQAEAGGTWLSCTQYWMLMRPTTLSALASLGVQSRMTSRHSAAMVCGGMLHALSPAPGQHARKARHRLRYLL